MPARSPSTRSREPRDRDDLIAATPARAVGKETRDGYLTNPSSPASLSRTRMGSARQPWAEAEVTAALGLSTDHESAPAPALDAMAAATPAEVQLARSLVQLGLAPLQILQTTLLDAYHRAVSALDAPAVCELALQIVSGVSQVEHARDQIGPGQELEPLRAELDTHWQAAVSQLAVQVSPQVLGGALVAASPEPPGRAQVVHLGAELIAREASRVLELLEAAERIRAYAAGAWSEGAALTLGAGEGGAALIGGAAGGAVGNVGARLTGDLYDQLFSGKEGFDRFSTYAQDFAVGGLFGAALAPLGLHAAKHLPTSSRTMAQTYAVHHPHMIPMLEAARAAGAGAAFRVRMTVREWLDVLRTGPGGPGSMGDPQPACSSAGAAPVLSTEPSDLASLPQDTELWITARPTADLGAPMARLDEDLPWFEVESVRVGLGGRRAQSLLDDYGEDASFIDDPGDCRHDSDLDSSGHDVEDIGTATPGAYGSLGERIRSVRAQSVDPDLADEYGLSVLSDSRLGITRNPRHHLLPQEKIQFFQENGFPGNDIDAFCVEVTVTEHEILHGGDQSLAKKYWRKREWNTALMLDLDGQLTLLQARRGADARLSRAVVLETMEALRVEFEIAERRIVPYRGDNE